MFPTRLITLLFFAVAVLPGTLAQAQYQPDSGQFLILTAQYGTDQNHMDVTNRLKQLARSDRSFVMDNNTFGVDPDYGRVKVLRIYAQGPDGREHMFEFREGSVVDGSQFRSWGRGDWGNGGWSGRWEQVEDRDRDRDRDRDEGQFVILSAQYGTNERHVDVTNRLRELARHDRTFVMGNSTFGVDPDYGRVKVLRIYARGPEGRERMFEFQEGSLVDGSQFRGWGRGDWGGQGWSGRWEGGDDRRDYDRNDEGEFVILSAQYGTRRHHIDVTDRLKDLARSDRTFVMNNNTFGTDPDYGRSKVLRIYTRRPDGGERMFEFRENSLVDGSQFRGWGRGDWGNERRRDRW